MFQALQIVPGGQVKSASLCPLSLEVRTERHCSLKKRERTEGAQTGDWENKASRSPPHPRVGILGPHSQPVSVPEQVTVPETKDVFVCKM